MTLLPLPTWRFSGAVLGAALGTLLLVSVSCDPTVDILDPSDERQFSLFGALNVAADTQVIRVDPIGDSSQIGAPPRLDVDLVLQDVAGGERTVLRDSFASVGAIDERVHNFWTTASIEPGTEYRILVEREGDPVTTAATETPPHPPSLRQDSTFYLPCTSSTDRGTRAKNTFIVEVRNAEHIAAADIIYPITVEIGQDSVRKRRMFSHYDAVSDVGPFFQIPFFYRRELIQINPDAPPNRQLTCIGKDDFTHPYVLVAVAAAGPGWPDWRGVSLNEIARPDAYSNVEGGHGFVAGIYSDTLRVPILDRPEN